MLSDIESNATTRKDQAIDLIQVVLYWRLKENR